MVSCFTNCLVFWICLLPWLTCSSISYIYYELEVRSIDFVRFQISVFLKILRIPYRWFVLHISVNQDVYVLKSLLASYLFPFSLFYFYKLCNYLYLSILCIVIEFSIHIPVKYENYHYRWGNWSTESLVTSSKSHQSGRIVI